MFCEALPVKVTLFFVIFMLGRIWREGDWNVLDKDVSSVNLFQTFPRHGFPQLFSTRLDSSYYFILNNTLIYLLIFFMMMMIIIYLASILCFFFFRVWIRVSWRKLIPLQM